MKRASGIGHLKPFLPGLETLLEDPEVSEIMINGPGNVWIERGGRLEPHEAPGLTAAWLHRAAIHIARPLGLDPAARPILDARPRGRLEGRHLHAARESRGRHHHTPVRGPRVLGSRT